MRRCTYRDTRESCHANTVYDQCAADDDDRPTHGQKEQVRIRRFLFCQSRALLTSSRRARPIINCELTAAPASDVMKALILPSVNFCLALVVKRSDLREIMSMSCHQPPYQAMQDHS